MAVIEYTVCPWFAFVDDAREYDQGEKLQYCEGRLLSVRQMGTNSEQ